MNSCIDIIFCDDEKQGVWDAYLERSPGATICHHFLWRSIIERAYKHQPVYLMAQSGRQVRGVLPLIAVSSKVFGKSLTSMPFLDYGGVCADDEQTARRLLGHALRLLQECKADYMELRQCALPPQTGAFRLDKFGLRLDLSKGVNALWQSFPAKVRNQVRKAEKSGLRACIGGAELLDEFYPVFATNMRDLGSPVHHRTFFAEIFSAFGQQARLVLVRDGYRAVGGLVCLFFKDTVTVPWASSLRQYLPQCPNNLLYWEAIQYACTQGYQCFDFGRSSVGSGTYNFKRQWGAKPVQIYWQILGRNGDSGNYALPANDTKFGAFVALWKRLPVAVTKVLGPRIRKYITN
jgi:FemAB-related protein (PEP-CTERM system-associated)